MGPEYKGHTPSIDELKSEFISTVSHELRTPLTAIGGYTRLIRGGDAGPVTDTQREFLSIIEKNVERLTNLINDILDLDQLDAVHLELRQEPQDLAEILRECRDNLILAAAQKKLEFKMSLPERLPLILGERGRLVQIFNNLISNAIKYTQKGFVEVLVTSEEDTLSVKVKDSGIGISSEEQKKLFQKFYRTDSSLASRERGTGLGLVITRGLVQAHGGRISVQSEVGQGSAFEVKFPITAPTVSIGDVAHENADKLIEAIRQVEESRRDRRSCDREDILMSSPKVLLAEDEEHIAKLILFKLGKEGFLSTWASNGEKALELGLTQKWDVIILDVMMPIQDGWEVLRELRKFSKSVPVLMLSAQASTDDFARSEELGATRFLKKPFDPAQLALVVREMTSQSENTPTDVLDLSEAREEFIDSFDSRRKSLIASLASLSTLEEDLQSGASKVSCKVSFEVKMIAHNIAGISGSYGFSALGSIAAEIDEHLVDEVSVSKLIACCERLDQALEYCIRSRQDCGEDCFTSSEESPASEATP